MGRGRRAPGSANCADAEGRGGEDRGRRDADPALAGARQPARRGACARRVSRPGGMDRGRHRILRHHHLQGSRRDRETPTPTARPPGTAPSGTPRRACVRHAEDDRDLRRAGGAEDRQAPGLQGQAGAPEPPKTARTACPVVQYGALSKMADRAAEILLAAKVPFYQRGNKLVRPVVLPVETFRRQDHQRGAAGRGRPSLPARHAVPEVAVDEVGQALAERGWTSTRRRTPPWSC